MRKLIKRLESCGFTVKKQDDGYFVSQYTPAGEDWGFFIRNVDEFNNYVNGFDPEEEFKILFNSGVRGLPKVSELIEDQYWKSETLNGV